MINLIPYLRRKGKLMLLLIINWQDIIETATPGEPPGGVAPGRKGKTGRGGDGARGEGARGDGVVRRGDR